MGISKEFLYKGLWTTIKFAPIGVVAFYASPVIIPVVTTAWAWLPTTIAIYKMRAWIPSLSMIKYGAMSVGAVFRARKAVI
jgi:hypothetical protein